jgi:hypothetical protein
MIGLNEVEVIMIMITEIRNYCGKVVALHQVQYTVRFGLGRRRRCECVAGSCVVFNITEYDPKIHNRLMPCRRRFRLPKRPRLQLSPHQLERSHAAGCAGEDPASPAHLHHTVSDDRDPIPHAMQSPDAADNLVVQHPH